MPDETNSVQNQQAKMQQTKPEMNSMVRQTNSNFDMSNNKEPI